MRKPSKRKPSTKPFAFVSLALLLVFTTASRADEDGQRLVAAIENGDLGSIAALLSEGVSPDARYGKDTAMTWAAALRDVQVMDLLYVHGAEAGADAALAAATEGRLEALKRLLEWGVDVGASDPYRMTLLMTAALHGHTELVAHLLDAGASVSDSEVVSGYTALMLASAHGYPEIVGMLIGHGADVNARTDTGESALSWAEERADRGESYGEVIALLLASGASP